MPRYRKIDPRIWKDLDFRPLTEGERLVCLYCLTAQTNRVGIFNFSPAMAAEDLETLPQTLGERLGNVVETFNWGWDSKARILYLPSWWKYNAPDNPNQLISYLADLEYIPQTHLFEQFRSNTRYLTRNLSGTFTLTLAERYPKRMPPLKLELELDPELDTTSAEPPRSAEDTVLVEIPTNIEEVTYQVLKSKADEYKETYPGIDVLQELREIRQWGIDNPDKRKTARGMPRHINSWMSRRSKEKQDGSPPEKSMLDRTHDPSLPL